LEANLSFPVPAGVWRALAIPRSACRAVAFQSSAIRSARMMTVARRRTKISSVQAGGAVWLPECRLAACRTGTAGVMGAPDGTEAKGEEKGRARGPTTYGGRAPTRGRPGTRGGGHVAPQRRARPPASDRTLGAAQAMRAPSPPPGRHACGHAAGTRTADTGSASAPSPPARHVFASLFVPPPASCVTTPGVSWRD